VEKSKSNLALKDRAEEHRQILHLSEDQARLEAVPVQDFVSLFRGVAASIGPRKPSARTGLAAAGSASARFPLRCSPISRSWRSGTPPTTHGDSAIRGDVTRHLLDRLVLVRHVRGPLLDVGSGAGLPGIPLALAPAGFAGHGAGQQRQKARFLRHAVRALKIGQRGSGGSTGRGYRPQRPFAALTSRASPRSRISFSLTGICSLRMGSGWR